MCRILCHTRVSRTLPCLVEVLVFLKKRKKATLDIFSDLTWTNSIYSKVCSGRMLLEYHICARFYSIDFLKRKWTQNLGLAPLCLPNWVGFWKDIRWQIFSWQGLVRPLVGKQGHPCFFWNFWWCLSKLPWMSAGSENLCYHSSHNFSTHLTTYIYPNYNAHTHQQITQKKCVQ